MDKLPPSTPPSTPPNDFLPIRNTPTSLRSASTVTTPQTISRNSASSSSSPATIDNITDQSSTRSTPSPTAARVGNFEGRSISATLNGSLPPHLRNRILAATPGTTAFATETQRGGVHPARAVQVGLPAATLNAANERRNPQQRENEVVRIHFQHPDAARIRAQTLLNRKPTFSPPKFSPKRTD